MPVGLVPDGQVYRKVARASRFPAPGITATVAPFRAWRSSRLTVAGKPTRTGGDYRRWPASIQTVSAPEMAVFFNDLRGGTDDQGVWATHNMLILARVVEL